MKIWIKISSENRRLGAWFFDLDYAKQCARSFEKLIPIELPDWPDVADDADHKSGIYAGTTFPDHVDLAYAAGLQNASKPDVRS